MNYLLAKVTIVYFAVLIHLLLFNNFISSIWFVAIPLYLVMIYSSLEGFYFSRKTYDLQEVLHNFDIAFLRISCAFLLSIMISAISSFFDQLQWLEAINILVSVIAALVILGHSALVLGWYVGLRITERRKKKIIANQQDDLPQQQSHE
jgi:hypothetical protein